MSLFDCACVQRNGHRDRKDPQDVERTTPCRQTWSKRLREETAPDCRDAHSTRRLTWQVENRHLTCGYAMPLMM